ncbi:hypothetical protein T484DRAFT_1833640 [Baffinella frigidus]|nr:hypothetical protein T484DRAFT_1833640 [Cryptophyta sp. CCMP2293]
MQLRARLAAALLPLLVHVLLTRPARASCPALYNETGHAVFPTASYLSKCGFVNTLGRGSFTVELWVQIPIGFAPPGRGGIPLFSFATDQVQDAILFWNVDYNNNKYALELKCKEIKSPGCVVLGQQQDQMCGSFHHKDEFVGNMTEVRLWSSARTESEILGHMWERVTLAEAQTTADLVAVWPLDCVYEMQELVAWQNLTNCTNKQGGPPDQEPGNVLLTLATIAMNDGETCSGIDECCEGTHNCDDNATDVSKQ